ncbi:MAG: hypothetical protein ACEB74_01965 [Desulfovibrio aminophilus]|uniref:hypothetical protein n=1 Tax=Desulfovibrio aminophilus TaxID=81425 RepID=UPI0039EB8D0D
MLKVEGDRALVDGVGVVPVFDYEAAEELARQSCPEPHEVDLLPGVCGLPDVGGRPATLSDNGYMRQQLSPSYAHILEEIRVLPWGRVLGEARSILNDRDLKPEAARIRAAGKVLPLEEMAEAVFAKVWGGFLPRLGLAEAVVNGIPLPPEPKGEGQTVVDHLRGEEARRYLMAVAEGEGRRKFLGRVAESGDLLALAACLNAPGWLVTIPRYQRDAALRTAVAALAPWALEWLDVERELLESLAGRLDGLRINLRVALSAAKRDMGLDAPGDVPVATAMKYHRLAVDRLAHSREMLPGSADKEMPQAA